MQKSIDGDGDVKVKCLGQNEVTLKLIKNLALLNVVTYTALCW